MKKAAVTKKSVHVSSYHHGDLRRALIQAALDLAADTKEWNFSLREVARRAGVSHNAPYNHFAHKSDLLAAAAIAGHDLLRAELKSAVANIDDPRTALLRMGTAYFKFGLENPALYSLMFNAALSGPDWHPDEVIETGAATRSILEDVLRAGASSGAFSLSPSRKMDLQTAALSAWAVIHGLTTLAIDGLANVDNVPVNQLATKVVKTFLEGFAARNTK